MKQRFIKLFDQSKKKKGIAPLSFIVITALFTGLLIACTPGIDFIKAAAKINVKQYGVSYSTLNRSGSYFYFSSGSSNAPEQDVLSLSSIDYEKQKAVTDSTLCLAGYVTANISPQAVLHGVNVLYPDGKKVKSLPQKGKLISEEDISINSFTGKLQVSTVNWEHKYPYQYTYSLSDGKNNVMLSFYASDTVEYNKNIFSVILNSLQVAVPRDKLYSKYVFLRCGSISASYTILHELPNNWNWSKPIPSGDSSNEYYESSVSLGALWEDQISDLMGAGDTLISKVEPRGTGTSYKVYSITTPDGKKVYRYFYKQFDNSGKTIELSFAAPQLLKNFNKDLVKFLLEYMVISGDKSPVLIGGTNTEDLLSREVELTENAIPNNLFQYAFLNGKAAAPYVKPQYSISFDFTSNPPSNVAVREHLLNSDGTISPLDQNVTFYSSLTRNANGYSFTVYPRISAPDGSEVAKSNIQYKGVLVKATWGAMDKYYVFVIKTDSTLPQQ